MYWPDTGTGADAEPAGERDGHEGAGPKVHLLGHAVIVNVIERDRQQHRHAADRVNRCAFGPRGAIQGRKEARMVLTTHEGILP